jgi:PLP dependent protein
MSAVRERIVGVKERIEKAALKAGRDPHEVKLVAVTKTVDVLVIREAVQTGAVSILGENYVQEAERKIRELGRVAAWHLIGHLQSNKAKYAVKLFDMIHSLDSLGLAEELDRRVEKAGRSMDVLIEVNVSGEASKFGIEQENVTRLAVRVGQLPHLCLKGLMTMPPYFDSPEMSRPYYVRLRELRERLVREGLKLDELSMGMSNDFEIAIEEGATYVRVGTAIFGARSR